MGRSAFLPDQNQLRGLLLGLHATRTAAPPAVSLLARQSKADSEPPPTPPRRPSVEALHSQKTAPPASPRAPSPAVDQPPRPLTSPGGDSLDERFAAFATWAKDATGAISVFVTDREGLSMVPSTAGEDYMAVAAEIAAAQRKMSQLLPLVEGGSTQLELTTPTSTGVRWVDLISCATDYGDFTVGLLLTEQLRAGLTTRLRTALRLYLAVDPRKSR
jgi:hypothetical protein